MLPASADPPAVLRSLSHAPVALAASSVMTSAVNTSYAGPCKEGALDPEAVEPTQALASLPFRSGTASRSPSGSHSLAAQRRR
mmetsp:Transcript_61765/g.163699  ORF Transcript_61765/g.163699 Transcript_61765/m.163699 type:complete len:83 (-) Transcript_61765:40-288(-)|eukprot:3660330-Prymnesium_polylepis.1